MLRLAIVANTPPPYRVPIFQRLARMPGVDLHVIFCSRREPNRLWDLPPMDFPHSFLRERFIAVKDRYIHNNFEVFASLRKLAPDVIVTDGFNPTHLYAFAYAAAKGLPHIPMTDGTNISEQALSGVHRAVRRIVYARSSAFVSASVGGDRLYQSYGIPLERCFHSCLCVDNDAFIAPDMPQEKRFDFIFCGRIEPGKSPLFALDVAAEVARRLQRRTSMLIVGSGSMEQQLRDAADKLSDLVSTEFHGFAAQQELPGLYRSARIFLFPTLADVWGVVANEACAAGLPVIVSPHAGVIGELVRDGENGFVCDIDVALWAQRSIELLTRPDLWDRFSGRSQELVSEYTFDNAATGLLDACNAALAAHNSKGGKPPRDKTRRVVIVERRLLPYRTEFYNRLRSMLKNEGIELQLLVGKGTRAEAMKKNEAPLEWARPIPTRYMLGDRVCWQPFGHYAREADLVVVMHENKLLYNLWLLSFGRPRRLAFWGHGHNPQSDQPAGLKERFKRWTVNKVDWWFASTRTSADVVTETGFPSERTTVIENAADTLKMKQLCDQVRPQDCRRLRDELGLGDGPVGLYLGSLDKEKRIGFLLDAAARIQQQIPAFRLLVAGDGSEQKMIEAAARRLPWIHYLGPLQPGRKAEVLVLADIMLNPGLVGLGILDSFASGTPLFTTDYDFHSPEISYLESGTNGIMTADSIDAYAQSVVDVLSRPDTLASLQDGALKSAPRYTIENMADRIVGGIVRCLSVTGRSPQG
ncbi:MAG: glycosyltransferase [Herminiimonas sp.]|nr:glycosyltransferase [Herminiimonas sp.]